MRSLLFLFTCLSSIASAGTLPPAPSLDELETLLDYCDILDDESSAYGASASPYTNLTQYTRSLVEVACVSARPATLLRARTHLTTIKSALKEWYGSLTKSADKPRRLSFQKLGLFFSAVKKASDELPPTRMLAETAPPEDREHTISHALTDLGIVLTYLVVIAAGGWGLNYLITTKLRSQAANSLTILTQFTEQQRRVIDLDLKLKAPNTTMPHPKAPIPLTPLAISSGMWALLTLIHNEALSARHGAFISLIHHNYRALHEYANEIKENPAFLEWERVYLYFLKHIPSGEHRHITLVHKLIATHLTPLIVREEGREQTAPIPTTEVIAVFKKILVLADRALKTRAPLKKLTWNGPQEPERVRSISREIGIPLLHASLTLVLGTTIWNLLRVIFSTGDHIADFQQKPFAYACEITKLEDAVNWLTHPASPLPDSLGDHP